MEDELLDIIREVEREKRASGVVPAQALFVRDVMPAVKQRVQAALRQLVQDGKVKWSSTINDDGFKLLRDEKDGERIDG